MIKTLIHRKTLLWLLLAVVIPELAMAKQISRQDLLSNGVEIKKSDDVSIPTDVELKEQNNVSIPADIEPKELNDVPTPPTDVELKELNDVPTPPTDVELKELNDVSIPVDVEPKEFAELGGNGDSDGDGNADKDDFCPVEEIESQKGTRGKASIVFFDMNDSYLLNMLQETIRLDRAFTGDYAVLFYDTDNTVTSMISSSKAIDNADEIHLPTFENLQKVIKNLVLKGYLIDLWIFSHGYGLDVGSSHVYGHLTSTEFITTEDIRETFSPNNTGCREMPIRLVYTITCFGAQINEGWRDVGAKVTVGSTSINFFPTQYGKFAEEFGEGTPVETAEDLSNTSSSRSLVHTYIEAEALVTVSGEGECGLIPNVLGKTDCAEWYFTTDDVGYNINTVPGTYDTGQSGKANINRSSLKIIDGDGTLTADSVPTWD